MTIRKRRDDDGWKRGEGASSNSDDLKLKTVLDYQFRSHTIDRSKIVDANAEANGGFPAPLTAPTD